MPLTPLGGELLGLKSGLHEFFEISNRVSISTLLETWTRERRDAYLFRPGALVPLSVDARCWPHSNIHPGSLQVDCISTVTTIIGPGGALDASPPNDFAGLLASCEFAGYDVADEHLLSTLSNCGFQYANSSSLRTRSKWSRRLNLFHLFSDLSDARRFSEFSDGEWSIEHAPTRVYGIWLAREDS
jgi:hypothetical protein